MEDGIKQIPWESGPEVKGMLGETRGFQALPGAPSPSSVSFPAFIPVFLLRLHVDYRKTAPVLPEPPPAGWNSREARKSFQEYPRR